MKYNMKSLVVIALMTFVFACGGIDEPVTGVQAVDGGDNASDGVIVKVDAGDTSQPMVDAGVQQDSGVFTADGSVKIDSSVKTDNTVEKDTPVVKPPVDLCKDVDCEDNEICTDDSCNPKTGKCENKVRMETGCVPCKTDADCDKYPNVATYCDKDTQKVHQWGFSTCGDNGICDLWENNIKTCTEYGCHKMGKGTCHEYTIRIRYVLTQTAKYYYEYFISYPVWDALKGKWTSTNYYFSSKNFINIDGQIHTPNVIAGGSGGTDNGPCSAYPVTKAKGVNSPVTFKISKVLRSNPSVKSDVPVKDFKVFFTDGTFDYSGNPQQTELELKPASTPIFLNPGLKYKGFSYAPKLADLCKPYF